MEKHNECRCSWVEHWFTEWFDEHENDVIQMFNPVEYLWEILDSNVRHRDVFQLAWDCFDVPPEELEEVVGQSEVLCLNCCLNNLDPDGWMDVWPPYSKCFDPSILASPSQDALNLKWRWTNLLVCASCDTSIFSGLLKIQFSFKQLPQGTGS